ncbi:glycoside hydrolase N-terminal domain-containing protein [Nonomuraea ferruginea]
MPDELTLWYEEPAVDWETQALPIGNGPLGAMVFGGVVTERIQFNEKTLWTGGPGHDGYDFGDWRTPRPDAVAEVRRRIDREGRVPSRGRGGRAGAAQDRVRGVPDLRRPPPGLRRARRRRRLPP